MTAPGARRAAIGWAAVAIGGLGVVAAVVMRLAGGSADDRARARAERRAHAEDLGVWSGPGDDDLASLAAARGRADRAAAELARAASDDPTAAAHVAMADDPAPLRLVIDEDGLTLDGAAVDDATLAARLADAVAADPDLALTITATPAVPHGRVVELMSAARAAGVHRLSFAAVTTTAPTAAAGAVTPTLQVRIGATSVFVDGDPVDDAALPARFRAAVAGDPDVRVVVEADASLPYARVVAVLDAARAAGVASIGMAAAP